MEEIDPDMHCAMAQEWLDKFHSSCFAWNTLTPSMHVLFWHTHAMIRFFKCPIGLLSEEGSEGDNKIIRQDRAHHTPQGKGLGVQLKALAHRSHQKANPKILRLTPEPERPARSLDYISDYLATPQPPLQPPPKDPEAPAASDASAADPEASEVYPEASEREPQPPLPIEE